MTDPSFGAIFEFSGEIFLACSRYSNQIELTPPWVRYAEEGVRRRDAHQGDVVALQDVPGVHVLLVAPHKVPELVGVDRDCILTTQTWVNG